MQTAVRESVDLGRDNMAATMEAVSEAAPSYVEGIQALVDSATLEEARRDLRLCEICMQWTVDGHECHRPGVCECSPANRTAR
jgi:hypothetical protein